MRMLPPLCLALSVLAGPVWAQQSATPGYSVSTVPNSGTSPPASVPTAAVPPSPAHGSFKSRGRTGRMETKIRDRFSAANVTHDGHLTRDQAEQNNWRWVAENFQGFDPNGRGYVTVDELLTYKQRQLMARRALKANPGTTPPGVGAQQSPPR